MLPALDVATITEDIRTIFFYVWHIITAENLLFGLAFLLMVFHKNLLEVRFATWIIVILMVVRWAVICGGTLWYNASTLNDTLMDSVAIAIYVELILLGTRVKDKQTGIS